MGLLLTSAIRLLFPPGMDQLQGANAPALWLKQAGGSGGNSRGLTPVANGIAAVGAAVLLVLVAYQLWK